MTTTATAALTPDQSTALAEIDEIVAVRRRIMSRLKAAESRTSDKTELRRIKRAKTEISRKNLASVNAKNRIRREVSLGPALARLSALRDEAQEADKALSEIACILRQAATIVNILGRLASIFV